VRVGGHAAGAVGPTRANLMVVMVRTGGGWVMGERRARWRLTRFGRRRVQLGTSAMQVGRRWYHRLEDAKLDKRRRNL
jgi:hypothetical protein